MILADPTHFPYRRYLKPPVALFQLLNSVPFTSSEDNTRTLTLTHTMTRQSSKKMHAPTTQASVPIPVFPQVCVSLPAGLLMCGQSSRLKLELANKSRLMCSCSVLLMGSQCVQEVRELKDWAASGARTPVQIRAFVDDLAEFLFFQGLFPPVEVDSSCSASPDVDPQGLLPVLKAQAQRPEMLHVMAEVRFGDTHVSIKYLRVVPCHVACACA